MGVFVGRIQYAPHNRCNFKMRSILGLLAIEDSKMRSILGLLAIEDSKMRSILGLSAIDEP